ncbi:hypothetical protein BDF21DRAFT_456399 [Thamnidium elegans]|nr:hypothetical protein BDF21DRAFT_456399 [Thamnidium elegans]
MSNWKGKSPMNKPYTGPFTRNASDTSSQHSIAKDAWRSYFSGENIISFPPETSVPPTYSDTFRETSPSRPKRTESIIMAECIMDNQKNCLYTEYPFASRRDEQMRYLPGSLNYRPRNRIKNESVSLDKSKPLIAHAESRVKQEYICCHCRASSDSTDIGSHCLTEFHIKCFNEGIICPNCLKDKK